MKYDPKFALGRLYVDKKRRNIHQYLKNYYEIYHLIYVVIAVVHNYVLFYGVAIFSQIINIAKCQDQLVSHDKYLKNIFKKIEMHNYP